MRLPRLDKTHTCEQVHVLFATLGGVASLEFQREARLRLATLRFMVHQTRPGRTAGALQLSLLQEGVLLAKLKQKENVAKALRCICACRVLFGGGMRWHAWSLQMHVLQAVELLNRRVGDGRLLEATGSVCSFVRAPHTSRSACSCASSNVAMRRLLPGSVFVVCHSFFRIRSRIDSNWKVALCPGCSAFKDAIAVHPV